MHRIPMVIGLLARVLSILALALGSIQPSSAQGVARMLSDSFEDGKMTGWAPRGENTSFWAEDMDAGVMRFAGITTGFQPISFLVDLASQVPRDYTATYVARTVDTSEIGPRVGGFTFRYVDDMNFIGVVPVLHQPSATIQFYLFKQENGAETSIGGGFCEDTGDLDVAICDWSQPFDPVTITAWREFLVVADDNHYTFSIDGTLILDFQDLGADFLDGSRIGMMFFGGAVSFPHDLEWDQWLERVGRVLRAY